MVFELLGVQFEAALSLLSNKINNVQMYLEYSRNSLSFDFTGLSLINRYILFKRFSCYK